MKVFLDDDREPDQCYPYMVKRIGKEAEIYLQDWRRCHGQTSFISVLIDNYREITHISFDHDLCDHDINGRELTGLNCAKYAINLYDHFSLPLPIIYIHSMNPVGAERIRNLFKDKGMYCFR